MKPIFSWKKPNNSKLGKGVATTYLPVGTVDNGGTCPASCPFLNNGCYAQKGRVNLHVQKTLHANPMEEALMIASVTPAPGQMLRLHVSGDFVSNAHLKAVDKAAKEWKQRGGGAVWAYTHNWRELNPKNAKQITLKASCHTAGEIKEARAMGWESVALAVPHFESSKAFTLEGEKIVPCPNQTKDNVTCKDCKLCAGHKVNVAFAKH